MALLGAPEGLAGPGDEKQTVAPLTLTNIAGIFARGLPNGGTGLPVRLDAVVLYADLEWGLLFLHDDTGAMHVLPEGITREPVAGDLVELTGRTVLGEPSITVGEPQLRELGRRRLPEALVADEEALLSGRLASRWVQTEGTVRFVGIEEERMRLELVAGATRLVSYVRHAPPGATNLQDLVGAHVRVKGVCSNRYRDNRIVGAGLLIPAMDDIEIIGSPPPPLSDYPTVSIHEAKQAGAFGEKAARIRIQGRVVGQRNSALTLKDATGSILTSSQYPRTGNLYDLVDAWGFPAFEDHETLLEDVLYAPARDPAAITNPVSGKVLETIREVRDLSREQATTHPRVHLKGVVTYADQAWKHFFLQDDTGAIFVRTWADGLRTGQNVVVDGVVEPGLVARMVVDAEVKESGQGTLPAPARFALKDLLSLDRDCAWVELDGVVRSVDDAPAHAVLQMVNRDGHFEAAVQGVGSGNTLRHLVDAEVRLRGINTVTVNDRGQFSSIQLRVPGPEFIQVLLPAPADPFSIDPRPIGAVRETRPALLGLQRIRVRGVITLVDPDGTACVQDNTGAIRVRLLQTNAITLGTGVDLVGFPKVEEPTTELEQAIVRLDPGLPRILPRPVSTEDIIQERPDLELVSLQGTLLTDAGGSTAASLLVQGGSVVFSAQFQDNSSSTRAPIWRANSLLQLTGLCVMKSGKDEREGGRMFELLLRSPADVVILQSPPWWTPRHAAAVGGALVTLALAGLAWVHLLRRQVREKTEQVRGRLEAEAALEKRLTLVWENAAEGMCLADAEGITVQVNEAYCRMVGLPRSELEGHLFAKVHAENQRPAQLQAYRSDFSARNLTATEAQPVTLWDGRTLWLEIRRSFLDQPGSPTLSLTLLRDRTAGRRAEEEKAALQSQLIQAQKMESVGRLAGGVAHDFNNILQVILANSSMAMEQVSPDHPLHADLSEIRQAALRSADITRQLLAFARKQAVSPRILDLNQAITGTLKMLQRLIGEDVPLAWTPRPGLWPVRLDPAQVDQVLANLTVNARDAIAAANRPGRVTIEAANTTLTAHDARADTDCVPGDYVRLSVGDDGVGMSAEVRDQLFEPFFTTKEIGHGTGLGLATVYGIVKQNRGYIRVESEPSQGTTFSIYWPRATGESAPAQAPAESVSVRGHETVLLVEDEEQILNLAHRILSQRGYTVLAARDPEEALAQLDRQPGPIHLLVTDVVMPGMNGRELKQRIAARLPGIRCLFISGYTADIIAHHGVLDEGVQFLAKPFSPDDLAARVRDLLDRSSTSFTAKSL